MKLAPVVLLLMLPAVASGATASTRIKIDTIPNEYTPQNADVREPVSMRDYHFEVDQETARARVVVDYTYMDELIYGQDDDRKGPQSTFAQIPGLKFDPQTHAVVYEKDGKQTVCAQVQEHRRIFGQHLTIKNTGSCFVSTEDTKHAEDDGWSIRRFRAIDTYFEVR